MTQAATGTGLKRFSYERPLIGAESKAFARLAGSTVLDFSTQVVREASETDLRKKPICATFRKAPHILLITTLTRLTRSTEYLVTTHWRLDFPLLCKSDSS